MSQGICHIVGAGPGDPGLLTLKALECLRRADIVFHDQLVSPEILALIPPRVERVDVGKHHGAHSIPQEEICRLLCEATGAGRIVVRLKGGDPCVLGRGGEEAMALRAAGLRFEIVPGVTAGLAAGAYAGVPVTHRGLATAVTLVSGHEAADKAAPPVDWRAMARVPGTLCIYMGVKTLRQVCAELMAGGRPADEPAAIIQDATLPGQRAVFGSLATLAGLAERAGLASPAIVLIGPTVALSEQCAWIESCQS